MPLLLWLSLQPARESYATNPEPFSGDLKIRFVLGLLRGRALVWAEAIHTNNQLEGMLFDMFMGKLRSVFDHPDHVGEGSTRLLNLKQGVRSVADYSVDSGHWWWTPGGMTRLFGTCFSKV